MDRRMNENEAQAAVPTIRTTRLHMRPLVESDRAAFVGVQSRSADHLRPWSPMMEQGETFDDLFNRVLQRSQQGLEAGSDYRFAAFDSAGHLVGMFNLNNVIRGVFQNAFAGWWLGVDSIGRGYGYEALSGLLGYAFDEQPTGLGLNRVQANIIPRNERSVRLAGRVGFREEGLARGYLKIAGEWQDHIMFAKLAVEHAAV